ncbi:MAG: HlyD family efflux transporter periplasmic adaptor subunit, partial [Planctomycetota bacterium]
ARATHDADVERALADKKRLERAQTELAACTITAPRDGLVIYPESKGWENAPKVEEGATVNKDQTLLLMPNLAEMQVKVGVHESMIDKMHPGMSAEVTLNKQTVTGNVDSVASVAKPAGWWTGNVVKYDCVVSLPETENLRPGMSAEVKILLADHSDTLLIPASAVVQTLDGYACWTLRADAAERVAVEVGDADDRFLQVVGGIDEGQRVIVDPLANVLAAQDEVSKMIQQTGNL